MKSEGLQILKCSLRFLFMDIKLIASHAKTVISPKPKIGSRGTRVPNARKQANKASNRVVQTFTVSEPVLTINIIKKWEWLKAFSNLFRALIMLSLLAHFIFTDIIENAPFEEHDFFLCYKTSWSKRCSGDRTYGVQW